MAAEMQPEAPDGPVAMMPRFGGPAGKRRSPWAVLGLSVVTLGIYHLYWLYKMYQEMADHTGDGPSGVTGLVVGIIPFVNIVNLFLLPHTVGRTFERAGQEPQCSALTGFWVLLPFVGGLVWLFRVQNSMNRYWDTRV